MINIPMNRFIGTYFMINRTKQFDQVFDFLAHIYQGNWKYRWEHVPFIDQESDSLKGESILAHMYSTQIMWLTLKQLLPNTKKLLKSELIYELLLTHDIGEIPIGDISRASQIAHPNRHKNQDELKAIENLVANCPKIVGDKIINAFKQFTFNDNDSLESLVANYLDTLQGNHFVLVYGIDLPQHSELINKIITSHFIPISTQLINKLSLADIKAGNEIQYLTDYHLLSFKDKGVALHVVNDKMI